jgi:hypothetical protein
VRRWSDVAVVVCAIGPRWPCRLGMIAACGGASVVPGLCPRTGGLDGEDPSAHEHYLVITPSSEPGVVQLYAVGIDVSAAYVAGVSQATWWLSTQEARRLHRDLGAKLTTNLEGKE